MNKLTWQDWVALISAVIGAISLFLTFFTFLKTGKIKKAVIDTQNDLINKFKYISHRQENINKLETIKEKFNVALRKKRDIKQIYSSGQIKQFFYEFQDVILCLSECTDHLKEKHKKIIADCEDYIKLVDNSGHIFTEEDCNPLQRYISEVLNILNQEDYLL